MRLDWRIVLGFIVALWVPTAAMAWWPDAVRQRVRGVDIIAPTDLETVAAYINTLPGSDRYILAAQAEAGGHWRLVNRAGETFSAASTDELTRGLARLLQDAPRRDGAPLTLYLTDDSLFRHRDALERLPAALRLKVLVGGEVRDVVPLMRGDSRRHFIRIGNRVLVEAGERAAYAETLRLLARPMSERPVRLLALEPGATTVLAPARRGAGPASGKTRPQPVAYEAVDPDRLRRAFSALGGETVLIVGRIEGERLVYQTGTGAERSLIMSDLTSAAAAHDVDLIVIRSPTARQPGTRNWLWLRNDIAGLEASLAARTLGGMLSGLISDEERSAISLTPGPDGRIRLTAQPLQRVGRSSALDPFLDVVTDLVSGFTGSAQVTSLDAHLTGTARRQELAARLVPGIPAMAQVLYLAGLILALPGLGILRQWWAGVWPPEARGDYGGGFGWIAARAVRGLAFVAVFMPFLGISATLWQLATLASAAIRPRRPTTTGAHRNPVA